VRGVGGPTLLGSVKKTSIIDIRCDPRLGTPAYDHPAVSVHLWDYFASIVASTTASWSTSWTTEEWRTTAVPCRRRPQHKVCDGHIVTCVDEKHMDWACTHCGDSGLILNCWGGPADLSRVEVEGQFDTDWLAAILLPQEYRPLVDPRWAFEPDILRILRAARATRPGIRIEAPRVMWDPLIMATAGRALDHPRTRARRLLRPAWHRFCDSRNLWV